ncbi:MAG: RNA pseudouridine synthase [Candidatus Pacebacteria bacterium]|nr:RNA pseudouridine synthase [Candidatus Paceibacterota bacterium]
MKINIIEKTKDYIVIEKPAGLMVHPALGHKELCLTDYLLKKFPQIKDVGEDKNRPGIVHRLDKNVSGIMVVALNQTAWQDLKSQFQKRTIKKEYLAIVHGEMAEEFGEINFPIKRSAKGFKMAAVPVSFQNEKEKSRQALTFYEVEKKLKNFTFLKVKIKTGRTHQIRVHLLALGYPLAGDSLYFNKKSQTRNKKLELNQLMLFAKKLEFKNLNKEKQSFELETPKFFTDFIERF